MLCLKFFFLDRAFKQLYVIFCQHWWFGLGVGCRVIHHVGILASQAGRNLLNRQVDQPGPGGDNYVLNAASKTKM